MLIGLCCTVYLPAVSTATWVHDDRPAVVNNVNVTWPPPLRQIFTTPYFGPGKEFSRQGLSRPLVTLTFCVEEALDLPPVGRKFCHWLYYVACTFAFWLALMTVLHRLWPGARGVVACSTCAAVLFALHPTHVAVVMSIAYRTETLALLFTLVATWGLLCTTLADGWQRTLFVSTALAMGLLCKESALCVMAPWLVMALALRGRGLTAPMFGCAAVIAAFLAWRMQLVGGLTVASIPPLDNPLAHVPTIDRVISAFSLVWLAAAHLLAPVSLAPDYSFDALQLPAGWTGEAIGGAAVVVGVVALAIGNARRNPSTTIALTWIAAFWAPVANILFAVPVLFADRLLFAPSAAFCALVGAGLVQLSAKTSRPRAATLGSMSIVAAVAIALTVSASFDWTDDHTLYRRGVIAQPRSVKMRLNYGLNRLRAKQPSRAIKHLQAAHALAPHDHDVRAALLSGYADTSNCTGGGQLVSEILHEPATPKTVRVAMLKWALACQKIGLANELGRGLGLSRRTRKEPAQSPKSSAGDTR